MSVSIVLEYMYKYKKNLSAYTHILVYNSCYSQKFYIDVRI